MNKKKISLLIISNSPGPNQSEFFASINNHDYFDLTVWYMGRTNPKWRGNESVPNYPHSFFININPFAHEHQAFLNPGIIPALVTANYDFIIVQGYFMPTNIVAMLLLNYLKRRWVFWGELVDRSNENQPIKQVIKTIAIGKTIGQSSLILVIGGERAKKSYLKFGIDEERLFYLPYSCNLTPYNQLDYQNSKNLKGLQTLYKSNQEKVILAIAQLIPRKNINLLIEAFLSLDPQKNNLRLLIGGEGKERENLMNLVPELCTKRVNFLGFIPKVSQPAYYHLADLFVLPSREDGWGMVVVEALASGVPVVTTNGVESASHLIREGVNGFVVPANNLDELREAVKRGLDLSSVVKKPEIRSTAQAYSSQALANSLYKILSASL